MARCDKPIKSFNFGCDGLEKGFHNKVVFLSSLWSLWRNGEQSCIYSKPIHFLALSLALSTAVYFWQKLARRYFYWPRLGLG